MEKIKNSRDKRNQNSGTSVNNYSRTAAGRYNINKEKTLDGA
jgi:hypothetical protein